MDTAALTIIIIDICYQTAKPLVDFAAVSTETEM